MVLVLLQSSSVHLALLLVPTALFKFLNHIWSEEFRRYQLSRLLRAESAMGPVSKMAKDLLLYFMAQLDLPLIHRPPKKFLCGRLI
jgi:hypothetical protein